MSDPPVPWEEITYCERCGKELKSGQPTRSTFYQEVCVCVWAAPVVVSPVPPTFTIRGYWLQCPWSGCEHVWGSWVPASGWDTCPKCNMDLGVEPAKDITPPAVSPVPQEPQ